MGDYSSKEIKNADMLHREQTASYGNYPKCLVILKIWYDDLLWNAPYSYNIFSPTADIAVSPQDTCIFREILRSVKESKDEETKPFASVDEFYEIINQLHQSPEPQKQRLARRILMDTFHFLDREPWPLAVQQFINSNKVAGSLMREYHKPEPEGMHYGYTGTSSSRRAEGNEEFDEVVRSVKRELELNNASAYLAAGISLNLTKSPDRTARTLMASISVCLSDGKLLSVFTPYFMYAYTSPEDERGIFRVAHTVYYGKNSFPTATNYDAGVVYKETPNARLDLTRSGELSALHCLLTGAFATLNNGDQYLRSANPVTQQNTISSPVDMVLVVTHSEWLVETMARDVWIWKEDGWKITNEEEVIDVPYRELLEELHKIMWNLAEVYGVEVKFWTVDPKHNPARQVCIDDLAAAGVKWKKIEEGQKTATKPPPDGESEKIVFGRENRR